ncbi:hypothetical protein M422DRAFT_255630 [Sphaerobolus stellatus SS14]|uniref:Alpha-type protein kinase domain-containing protein n=1 Tax=Sphaerobolus stellatus (strain SS14) TaxID=990650 RepID=A0A0C9VSM4_SPHS4|nr:hypothetical protein M422DRAFT_255630 [Sphaerobolus stellatus SS14]
MSLTESGSLLYLTFYTYSFPPFTSKGKIGFSAPHIQMQFGQVNSSLSTAPTIPCSEVVYSRFSSIFPVPGHPGSLPASQAVSHADSSFISYTPAHRSFAAHFQMRAQQAYGLLEVVSVRAGLGYNSKHGKFEKIGEVVKAIPNVPAHIGLAELRRTIISNIAEEMNVWLWDFQLDLHTLVLSDQHGTPIPQRYPDIDVILNPCWDKNMSKSITPKWIGPPQNRPVPIFSQDLTRRTLSYRSRDTSEPWDTAGSQENFTSFTRPVTPPLTAGLENRSKRRLEASPRSTEPTTPKCVTSDITESSVFVSPPRAMVIEALKSQGAPSKETQTRELNTENLFVSVEILAERSFTYDDLLAYLKIQFTPGGPFVGNLKVDFKAEIGTVKGAFKTAHRGILIPLDPHFSMSTEFPWQKPICVKWLYIHQCVSPKMILKDHYLPSKELELTDQELRCYPFADALMRFVYKFITQETVKLGSPPFSIPRMQYVKVAHMRIQGINDTIMAEEMISEPFVKHMNNTSPEPLPDLDEEDLHHAEFLWFAQHVQWEKTGGLAFISDFQGGRSLLTDPQVMTSPDLGDDLFAGGNIPFGFNEFCLRHHCNNIANFSNLSMSILNRTMQRKLQKM